MGTRRIAVTMLILILIAGCNDPNLPNSRDVLLFGLAEHQVMLTLSLAWYETGEMSEADQEVVTGIDAVEFPLLNIGYNLERQAGDIEQLETAYNLMMAARVAWYNR